MTLSEHVKNYVDGHKISWAEMARRIDIDPTIISRVIRDDYYTPYQAHAIEEFLGVSGYAKTQTCKICGKIYYPRRIQGSKCDECVPLARQIPLNQKIKVEVKRPKVSISKVEAGARKDKVSYGIRVGLEKLNQRG